MLSFFSTRNFLSYSRLDWVPKGKIWATVAKLYYGARCNSSNNLLLVINSNSKNDDDNDTKYTSAPSADMICSMPQNTAGPGD